MFIRLSSALLVALVCATPPLLAQQSSTPPTELRQLSLFVGSLAVQRSDVRERQ